MELSQRQLEVCGLTAQGQTERQIASMLGISLSTVKQHKAMAYRKLGVHNAVELTNALKGGKA